MVIYCTRNKSFMLQKRSKNSPKKGEVKFCQRQKPQEIKCWNVQETHRPYDL